MSHNPQTWNKTHVVRSGSSDPDVRCRITITTKLSNVIIFQNVLDITMYRFAQVYKVKHLKQQLVNGLSQFKCVLVDIPKPPCRLISATVDGIRREKFKDNIIQLLNKFSGYCEECTVSRQAYKIFKDSDFLFTVIANRGSKVDIVYCKDDYIEWAVILEGCSEKQKLDLMLLLDNVNQTRYILNGNEISIITSPNNTDFILDICHNFDNGGCTMIYRGTSNESHVNTNITIHGNDSEEQSTLSSNSESEDGHSQRKSPSSLNTEPEDMTMRNDTNVPSTTLLEATGGAGPEPENWVVVNHLENGEDTSLDQKKDIGDETNKEDKNRLSSTIPVTTNYLNTDGEDLKRIDLIYLELFNKRKQIQDKILHFLSQSGYNKGLSFNEDGSIKPPLNNQEFFALNVAIRKYLDIKMVSLKQYNLSDSWFDSMNVIENNIVVERREPHIVIVGLKDIVERVLVNLRQYKRKVGVCTEGHQQIETNRAAEGTEYFGLYHIGINCPLECEYICKAGDHLLYELQKTYSCFIDIQPLVTGTKEIHFANWIYKSKEAGHIEIPLIIGDHRTLPDQSDILVLEQNQTDQSYESGQQSSDNLAHYRIMPDSSKQHLEDRVKKGKYKTLILLMDKTTKKETVSFFLKACKDWTKRIYLPMKSRPQVNCYLLQTLFEKGELKYGGQDTLEDVQHHQPCKGHYIEMKIGQINNQNVDVIVDVVESQTLPHRYDIKTVKVSDKPFQYKIELNVPPYRFDSSSPIIRVALMVNACLREVSEKKLASIAFPVLCMGHVGYPVNLVAKSMMETIDEFFKFHNDTSLCHVMIVIHEHGTRSEEVFCAENLSRIKAGRMAGDTIHRVNIEIAGDKLKKEKIEKAINNIIEKKEIPVTVDDVSSKRREENMAAIRSCAIEKRDGTHESRCVIIEYTAKELGMANVKNVLVPNLKAEIQPLCVVSPFQDNVYKAFLAFGSKKVKDEACALIKKKYETSKFIDMPASQEVLTPVIHRVNVHIQGCNALKKGLQDASGVYTMSTNGEVFIEGCPQQIELAKIMLQEKYGKKYNQNTGLQPVQVEPCSVKTYKFRALKCLFGQDKMKMICGDVKEVDGETHFILPKDSKDKLVEDLEDLMYRIRHEEIDVNDNKIEEAKRYRTNHAHMDTVYVEFDTKTSSIHILGEDYVEVELVSYQAKVAVGIIKLTNKKQESARTDEYTPTTPPVKLAPPVIQERIFYTKCKNLTVCVKKSDITRLDVDVIVNAANGMMKHGGGVARFIATAGGDELERQCRRYIDDNGELPVTGICKTTGGNMICKQVYHAVGPCWYDYSNKPDCEDDLCKTIVRCLVEADQDGFQSIAIPSISSAIFGVPKNICAHMYAKAVKSFDAVYPVSNLREIYFVDVIDGMVSMVQTGFDMFFTQGDDDDLIKEEIERFIKGITCKAAEQQSGEEITDNKPPEFSMIAVTKEVDNKPYITCSLQSIITLHIYQAAVLLTNTDSITTWEDTAMTNFKASAKKIINAAGDVYKEERSKLKSDGDFKAGSVLTTSAGCLPYQHIYHLISSLKPDRRDLDVLMDNLVKEISMTTDTSVTIDIGNIDADVLFTSIVNLFKTAKPSTLKEIHLVAESEDKIKKLHSNYEYYIKQLGGIIKKSDINCSICLEEMSVFKTLPCGHTFCEPCVDAAIAQNPVCPICRSNAYGEIQKGNQPDGKMEHHILHAHLEGFSHCDTIEIIYSFNDGIQSANHPRPGYPFKGKTETAYLPDNMEGREILKLLKLAFDKRLIFTVSPDVTSSSGREFVTWSNIPHKTRQDGGPENNGYPDPDYLNEVKKALHTRGVIIQNTN
ncbi:uncharacterized protein LOC126821890 [Patella vulgata]|uniref:uncharacterized protein LOC126821890 n=1 Tax=Patella vulgata TaxID=6465 RepID=UPI0021805681|nr:uncharacterized protein LOC126821890 [Patella vulgata]